MDRAGKLFEPGRFLIVQGPLLLTWINFNPDMDKQSCAQ